MEQRSACLKEFPFRLADGPTESKYVTWLRNNSNYMVTRGILDYARIVAVLVRGILVNFLVLVPSLLVAAILLAGVYGTALREWEYTTGYWLTNPVNTGWMSSVQGHSWNKLGTEAPYLFTPWVAAAALFWFVIIFPVGVRIFKIGAHKASEQTGVESSVRGRDRWELTFSFGLIAVGSVALVESVPQLVHHFHQLRELGARGAWATVAGGSAVAALSGAGRLLDKLDKGKRAKIKRALAIVAVGLLGLLLPLILVFYVTEFLVYRPHPIFYSWSPFTGFQLEAVEPSLPWQWLLVLPLLMVLGMVIALIIGTLQEAFTRTSWLLWRLGLLVVLLAVIYRASELLSALPWLFVLAVAFEVWLFCWLAVDINLTSGHGLFRDRLVSAYLVKPDNDVAFPTGTEPGENCAKTRRSTDPETPSRSLGRVTIEHDVDLSTLCQYENGSTAPYNIINVALNLQGSKDRLLRDRNSDFFIFSKKFIGGKRTGYCRTETMERVYPELDLGSAMATSAAAASPNMGTFTSRLMVATMTLFNVRLGLWIPNPGMLPEQSVGSNRGNKPLERWWGKHTSRPGSIREFERRRQQLQRIWRDIKHKLKMSRNEKSTASEVGPSGCTFEDVYREESEEIKRRWRNVYGASQGDRRPIVVPPAALKPSCSTRLVGLAFSGGGIRSATINLGISQALDRAGAFRHVDYLSTVSGGGFLGSSIGTLMRCEPPRETANLLQAITDAAQQVPADPDETPALLHSVIEAATAKKVPADMIARAKEKATRVAVSLEERLAWRVRPSLFIREMLSRLHEQCDWVNVSDGGHIENLAAMELLRRRCKYLIVSDAAADENFRFGNLATLIRYARIDLGIKIEIDVTDLRPRDLTDGIRRSTAEKDLWSNRHFAIGRITYPNGKKSDSQTKEDRTGYLLFFKSSYCGKTDELITEYRARKDKFPHESTADQFFDEGQFEAYRALGQEMAEEALGRHQDPESLKSFDEFERWFQRLASDPRLPRPWAPTKPEPELERT